MTVYRVDNVVFMGISRLASVSLLDTVVGIGARVQELHQADEDHVLLIETESEAAGRKSGSLSQWRGRVAHRYGGLHGHELSCERRFAGCGGWNRKKITSYESSKNRGLAASFFVDGFFGRSIQKTVRRGQ